MKEYNVPICTIVKIPVHAHFKPTTEVENDACFESAKDPVERKVCQVQGYRILSKILQESS